MMHKNFMHQHLRVFVVQRSCMKFQYYFLIKILILIRKASPEGAACFVIYKKRNHKTSLI